MNSVSTLPLPTIRARTLGSVPITFDFRGVLLFSKPGVDDGWTAPWTATPKDMVKAAYGDVAIFGMQANLPAEIISVDIELDCGGIIRLTLFNTGKEAVFAICSWWDGNTARLGTLGEYLEYTCPFLPTSLPLPAVRTGFLLADHLVMDDTVESVLFVDMYFATMGVNVACISSLTGNPSIVGSVLAQEGFKLGWQCRQGQDDIPPMGSVNTPEVWASNLVNTFRAAKWPLDKIGLVIISDEPALYSTDPADADKLAAHMAHCMAALRALIRPDCLLCYNSNNASLRSFSPDGQVAIDPFVFAKLTANDPNVILWSEDWMGDEGSQLITWPFFSSVAQSAGKKWGGYIIGQTAGEHYGDRIRSMIERGATVCFNYHAGPDFVRVNDSYWAKRESVWSQVRGVFNGVG